MGLSRSWCPFYVALEWHYPPGLVGVDTGQCAGCQPLSCPFLGKPMNLRGLVQGNDGSAVPSLSLLIATCSQRRPVRFRVYLVLSPLHGLMVSRYRGGYAFTVYFSGWELRPTSSTKLLRFISFLPIPEEFLHFGETGRTAQALLRQQIRCSPSPRELPLMVVVLAEVGGEYRM